MKVKLTFALVGTLLVFSILACDLTLGTNLIGDTVRGSGSLVEENRTISGISGVKLAMPGTLHIAMGSSEALVIEAEENLLEYIQTEVRGGKLQIDTRQGINLQPREPIDYYLTVVQLESIEISSSGDVETVDLQSDSFRVNISSSGNLSISSLDSTNLRVEITSSGDLDIMGGEVREQDIRISSSGEYRARDLASQRADVSLTSSGSATIWVSDVLSGSLSSSGNIYYVGNPSVDVRESSSGRVERID
ncbi:MAG: DUF2807 domain-containing protein [Chloroflexota bacterium]|nr:MAG: DUF2807 domain-containing protein [Chloroflexota bacterium]